MAIGVRVRVTYVAAAALLVGLMVASCGGDPTNAAGSAAASSETTTLPPTTAPSEVSVDDPATAEIEVAGELLARKTGKEECTTAGDVERCAGATWEGDYSMSDPRLSGRADVVFYSETGRKDRFQWWLTSVLRPGGARGRV